LLFFIVGLISLLAFKAKASTIFWSNGFDYDANGLIYSGDFITPTQRGFAPVITDNNFNFSYGFSDGGGYLIADDSTNTTPFISGKAWRFLDENNNLVYNFSGQSLPFDFVLWLDNQHTNNYGVKFYSSFSFFKDFNVGYYYNGSLGDITQSLYFLDDNNNVLVVRHKITGWYYQMYLWTPAFWLSNQVDIELLSQWGNSTSTFNYNFIAIRQDNLPSQAWFSSGVFDFSFSPNQLNIEYQSGDGLANYSFDLPVDFTKSISKAFVKFEFSGYPLQNDLDFLRFDNLRFTSIDYVPYSKTPTPTTTPTPTPTPPVPVPQTPNCEPPEGNFFTDFVGNVKYAMCLALNYVFVPNDNQKNYLASQLADLKSLVQNKPPFGYFYLVQDKLNALSVNSTTSDYFVDFNFFDITTTIKKGLNYILWLVFLLYILKRLSII